MPTPGEHKTVQARIIAYAEAIHLCQGYGGQVGLTILSREEAEQRRGLRASMKDEVGRMKGSSLFFDDLLDARVREFPVRRSLNRREHKEGFDWSIWPQAAAKFPGWEFLHRLCQNRLLASEHICNSLLQNSYIV